MSIKRPLIWFLLGCAVTGLLFVSINRGKGTSASSDMVSDSVQGGISGYTSYRNYLAEGKKLLQERSDLLTARITREERFTQFIEKKILGIPSDAVIEITYKVEYPFGYRLTPEAYELKDTTSGIVIEVGRPVLLLSPSIKEKNHRILSAGFLINEDRALVASYERTLDALVREQGERLAVDAAVQALCERQLIGFLKSFLAGKKVIVPNIEVQYKDISK